MLAILEALRLFLQSFHGSLVVESDSTNAITRVSQIACKPWKFHFCFNEIKFLVSCIQVVFRHVIRSSNGVVDVLAKQGIDRSVSLGGAFVSLWFFEYTSPMPFCCCGCIPLLCIKKPSCFL